MKRQSLVALLAILSLGASVAWAGELRMTPGIGVSGEYTDNVDEERHGKTDYIGHAKPTMEMTYDGPHAQGSLSYKGDYASYASGRDDMTHDLLLDGLATLAEDRFFVAVTDTYRSVYADSTRGEVPDGETANDRVNRNIFSVSPYTRFKMLERGEVTSGYEYRNTAFSGDGSDEDNKQEHAGFADLDYALTSRSGVLGGYRFTAQTPEKGTGLTRHNAYVGGRYEIQDDLVIKVRGGADYTRFNDGQDDVAPAWNVELSKTFKRLTMTLLTDTRYVSDADTKGDLRQTRYALTGLWDWGRTRLDGGLEFAEYVTDDGARSDRPEKSVSEDVRTITPHLGVSHDLTPRFTVRASSRMEFQDKEEADVRRFYATLEFVYSLTEEVKASLAYRFKNAHSDDSEDDRYTVNRVELGLGMTF